MQEQTLVSLQSNFSFPSHRVEEENTAGVLFLFFCENFRTIVYMKSTTGTALTKESCKNKIAAVKKIFYFIIIYL